MLKANPGANNRKQSFNDSRRTFAHLHAAASAHTRPGHSNRIKPSSLARYHGDKVGMHGEAVVFYFMYCLKPISAAKKKKQWKLAGRNYLRSKCRTVWSELSACISCLKRINPVGSLPNAITIWRPQRWKLGATDHFSSNVLFPVSAKWIWSLDAAI